ncbi:MAG: GNAT family N-acetyltransferase, partial [Limisphaerales bacterium]
MGRPGQWHRPPEKQPDQVANPDDNFVFGAFQEGQLVGTAGFFRYPLAKARHKGRIWGVYVRANCRGRGIGRALLIALLERI